MTGTDAGAPFLGEAQQSAIPRSLSDAYESASNVFVSALTACLAQHDPKACTVVAAAGLGLGILTVTGYVTTDPYFFGSVDNQISGYHTQQAKQSFLEDVKTLASAPDNAGRIAAVKQMLDKEGFSYKPLPFDTTTAEGKVTSGTNLLADVTVPEGEPKLKLLLMAHMDKVGAGSEGTYDNMSGAAVIFALARLLRDNPPEVGSNAPEIGSNALEGCQVQLLYTDREEDGLLGAKAFVADCKKEGSCPGLVINVDLAGKGNVLYVGSSKNSHAYPLDGEAAPERMAENPLETEFINAVDKQLKGTPVSIVQYDDATPQSDHIPAQRAGIAAVGFSQMNKIDAENMAESQRAAAAYDAFYQANKPGIDKEADLYEKAEEACETGGGEGCEQAKAAHEQAVAEIGQDTLNRNFELMDALFQAREKVGPSLGIHNDQDTIEALKGSNIGTVIDALEGAIRAVCKDQVAPNNA